MYLVLDLQHSEKYFTEHNISQYYGRAATMTLLNMVHYNAIMKCDVNQGRSRGALDYRCKKYKLQAN